MNVVLCAAEDVPVGTGVAALLPTGEQVAVFHYADGEFYGLANTDPFSGAAVLSRGILGDHAGTPVVASPMHKQRFDLRTGECVDDPAVRVRTHPVEVRGGTLYLAGP
ncbi:nitrite reductase small subunit NirD [Amycolatopsis suaedae]|uniref:Nitrite reductase small subunit NirD n=1 Tax=Amycolatopsis suaedae TaxID=2510978 RepID=A0A4Q7J6Z1_9PSEU|nr:nitrite reductase small subunit NirD [Amycolatopsis suaedae]RZQ62626.1 nitrite reductase small subunit NirD [Amycolatopsis suaedae]